MGLETQTTMSAPTAQPLLFRFAEPISESPLIGAYDPRQEVWVVIVDGQPTPLIRERPGLAATKTVTRVRDDVTDTD